MRCVVTPCFSRPRPLPSIYLNSHASVRCLQSCVRAHPICAISFEATPRPYISHSAKCAVSCCCPFLVASSMAACISSKAASNSLTLTHRHHDRQIAFRYRCLSSSNNTSSTSPVTSSSSSSSPFAEHCAPQPGHKIANRLAIFALLQADVPSSIAAEPSLFREESIRVRL